MIQHELRLNNIIDFVDFTKSIREGKVTCITAYKVTLNERDPIKPVNLMPIPLTEEWLLKFGFKESGRDINIIHWYNGVIYLNSYELDFNGYWLRYYRGRIHCKINYVHQLQNLYFALTGEELTQ
jgi:hypothetical protein